MATASTRVALSDCHICQEPCNDSRKLPACEHQCCETCILIYISKLKDNGELEIGFPCPSCKMINPGPKDRKAAIEWIKSLEKSTDNETETENKVTQGDICNTCKIIGKSTKAMKLCMNCHEAFCELCSLARHSHQTLQDHKVVDVDSGDTKSCEPGSLFNLMCEVTSCDTHSGNSITFFCKDHEEYGCETCVDTKHKQCIDVVKANSIAVNEDADDEAKQLKASAKNLSRYAQTMIDANGAEKEANNEQVEAVVAKLKAIRENIKRILRDFEDSAISLARSTAKKRKSLIHIDTLILESMIKTSTLSLTLLEKLVSVGSPSQIDMMLQKMKQLLKSNEDTILRMSETFKKVGIQLEQEDLLLKLPNVVNDYIHGNGAVLEKEYDSRLPVFQSLLLLKQSKVTKLKEISVKMSPISSVFYTGNNNILLVDETNKCCLMRTLNAEIKGPYTLPKAKAARVMKESTDTLFRKASQKDNLVAIPNPSGNSILLLATDEKVTFKGAVHTPYQPKALYAMTNGDIAVAWSNPVAFGIISSGKILIETKVYFRRDKSGRELKTFDYIAVDEKRSHVIQPCSSERKVYCFDFAGNPKFSYGGTMQPKGVALDGDSNIYVAYFDGCFLSILSPDGKLCRTVSDEIPRNPLAIDFNKDGDELAVTKRNSDAVTILKLQKYTESTDPVKIPILF